MADTLLVELLTEELPPKALPRLAQSFADALAEDLRTDQFLDAGSAVRWLATPRRLAVEITAVRDKAPDAEVLVKGPSVKGGLDAAGAPTPALLGFAKKRGVAVEALERVSDGKQEVFAHRARVTGGQLAAELGARVEEALKRLPVPKLMRWGAGEAQFVRPVHGLMMLHGRRLVAGQVLGLESRGRTRGHRFLATGELSVADAARYEETLESEGKVIACFERRRRLIERQLHDAAQRRGLHLNAGYVALLDEVTALVEWPVVYEGSFEDVYLEVPQECLILTMQQNQKYFPLLDGAGRLTHRFLIVSNMAVADPRHIVGGNQRVVRPRLADARFFYDQDRKTPLAQRVERLATVVYHNRLGSQLERVARIRQLAGAIAARLGADRAAAERAALLAKADLVTDMVGEFPELQGIMGRYYARHDGESETVARAIEQHYRPRFAGDALPEGNVALAVALADRLDALAGFFGIGQLPTGDKDPFGLRRAALGVLRMLGEAALPLDLRGLIDEALAGFEGVALKPEAADALHEFMLERLRHHLRETGAEVEAVDAVLAGRPGRIDLVAPRLEAVKHFVALPEAQALAAANKRIVNILKKAEAADGAPEPALFQEAAERTLFARTHELAPRIESLVAAEDYSGALVALAGLREPVDAFFDQVMVMAEEPLTRQNRLALLAALARLMNRVADISQLARGL